MSGDASRMKTALQGDARQTPPRDFIRKRSAGREQHAFAIAHFGVGLVDQFTGMIGPDVKLFTHAITPPSQT